RHAPEGHAPEGYANGRLSPAPVSPNTSQPSYSQADSSVDSPQSQGSFGRDEVLPRADALDPARVDEQPPAVDDYPSTLRTTVDNLPAYGRPEEQAGASRAGVAEESPRTDRLYAVEQQYEQFRR